MSASPVILGIDATTGRCSVALAIGASVLTREASTRTAQTATVLDRVETLLAETGLARSAVDAIACTCGPGAFTGVRVSTGIGQGLATGLDRPVIGLSTLQVVAETALRGDVVASGVLVLQDARMGEVYGGLYGRGNAVGPGSTAIREDWLGEPVVPALPAGTWLGAGSGFAAYPSLMQASGLITIDAGCSPDMGAAMPLAQQRLAAGHTCPGPSLEPVYLRHSVTGPR